ncbi:MAG: hypothetical protein NTU94_01335 [Planctomycetota bacterium]|nr:hypothetical protein [Planctomycetota bacterium]
MLRFVVQQHFLNAEDWHYDLMLEGGEALVTFSSHTPPDDTAALPALVRQLPSHRLAYLEYEGEMSGGRGWCDIYDGGTMEWIAPNCPVECPAQLGHTACDYVDEVAVRLDGRKVKGVYRFVRESKSGADYWRMRRDGA